ncbi:putative small auxin-up RNA [Lupinus albus]|uniref:Putative small auxin-up RNA n=1 Tax=Lupinus albus TaxID=3870 RepID=A0A6A4PT60_LUPAL|nr:putative small auxin-up RNA [Lupinus albus]
MIGVDFNQTSLSSLIHIIYSFYISIYTSIITSIFILIFPDSYKRARCKSIGGGHKSNIGDDNHSLMTTATTWRSRSCPNIDAKLKEEKENSENKKGRVAPEGCFSVYVGPQMQRFVIKTEYANHPLFKMLLEEAESEYGYNSQGPLALPCKVEIFYKVLAEMDEEGDNEETPQGCAAFRKRSSRSYQLLSPSRIASINHS